MSLLRDRARVVLWGLGIVVGVQAAATFLAQNRTGAVLAQFVIAEFGTGYLGVAWSDPLAPLPSGGQIARRAGKGALLGAAAAAVLVGASVMLRAATLEPGTFGVAALLIGLLVSAASAARDELLLRGLVLRALGPNAKLAVRLAVCAAAGMAWRFGTEPGVTLRSLAFAGLGSVALACLWLRDRGAWLAVGANAAFVFATGPLTRGALLDVRAPGDLDASWIAVACGLAMAASAVVWGPSDRMRS